MLLIPETLKQQKAWGRFDKQRKWECVNAALKIPALNVFIDLQDRKISPGGRYWQYPEELTNTFVWNVASNLSSALCGGKKGWTLKAQFDQLQKQSKND